MMVMSMDGHTDQRMGSPMDESSVIGIRHQGSVDEELNEDEHSKASVQTVVGKQQQQLQLQSRQQQPIAPLAAQSSGNQRKQQKQHSAMVVSREQSFDDERKLTMHIDENPQIVQVENEEAEEEGKASKVLVGAGHQISSTRVVVGEMSDQLQRVTDLGREDSLITRMREIVEGGQSRAAGGQQMRQHQQQAQCQQAKSSSGDSLNNQAENNSKASTESNQKRLHHSRHCDRHHHHHHHHHQHQRPSLGALSNQTSAGNHHRHHAASGQHHHRHHHHNHHNHHHHHHQQSQAASSSSATATAPGGASMASSGCRASASCQKRSSSSQRPVNLLASDQVDSLEQQPAAVAAVESIPGGLGFVQTSTKQSATFTAESKSSTTSSVSSSTAVLVCKTDAKIGAAGSGGALETIEASDKMTNSALITPGQCNQSANNEGELPHHHHHHSHNHHHHRHLHSHPQQQHPHHHHHHHYYNHVARHHHHHRNHKKRLVLDTDDHQQQQQVVKDDQPEVSTSADSKQTVGDGQQQMVEGIKSGADSSKKLESDECNEGSQSNKRAPLQETTSHLNVCCPHHERHCTRANDPNLIGHHPHPHHRHHHHHHHHQQHHHHNRQQQPEQNKGQKKEVTDELTGEQQSSAHWAHQHHRQHHHHHTGNHNGKSRQRNKHKVLSFGEQQTSQQQQKHDSQPIGESLQTAGQLTHKTDTIIKTKLNESSSVTQVCDNNRGSTDINEEKVLNDDVDLDSRMHLDDHEDEHVEGGEKIILEPLDISNTDEVVTMDMSPNGDKRLDVSRDSATKEALEAKPSLAIDGQSLDRQGSNFQHSGELHATTTTSTIPNQATTGNLTQVGVIENSSVCAMGVSGSDSSNPTNSSYEFTRNQEGDSVKGNNKQANQLVRQVSSSRESQRKEVSSGGNGGGKGTRSNRQQEDDQLIECLPQESDTYQQASQPKQIIESAVPPDRRCRLCWCCCCPCSSLSNKSNSNKSELKPNAEAPAPSVNKCTSLPNVPLEEIRLWGDSFDRLMKCPDGRKVFQDFLRCEYSEENILFWIACEELKSEKEAKNISTKARDIYEDYISILSEKEVSLDSRVRDEINNNIKKPTSKIFDEAQLQIYTLMHRDSYPRFLNSTMYKKLAQIQTTSRKGST